LIRGVSQPGWFADASRKIRESVRIPVLLTGGIRTKKEAEDFLNDGSADLVGIGRPMITEPEDTIREFLG
jgi:2,4-dienoyl-CoA reductase-like NADH-dependent reductase (Old Yellow Enzyme family)